MEPRTSQQPEPRYEPDQLVVAEGDVEQVTARLRAQGLRAEPRDEVGAFRVLEISRLPDAVPAPDDAPDDLVRAALAALQVPGARAMPLAEPNYVYGCPQMRGGQFVVPDPADRRDVELRPSPVGAGVRVLVLDTAYAEAPLLDGIVPQTNAAGSLDDPPDSGELAPAAAHCTFVIGQILRVAPGAEILPPMAVLDHLGQTNDTTLAQALNAIDLETDPPHLINLSLGGYTLTDELSAVLGAALERLTEAGIVVVAAAGNNDSDRRFLPAAGQRPGGDGQITLSVGAVVHVGREWARAAYSDYGDWVAVCAPGQSNGPYIVWSRQPQPYDGWAGWSGTSFSTPVVVGALAALMSMQGDKKDPQAAVDVLLGQSPEAPGDFPVAKVVNPPVLWPN